MRPINESLIIFSLFLSLSSSTLSKELVGVSGEISDNEVKDDGDVDAIDDDDHDGGFFSTFMVEDKDWAFSLLSMTIFFVFDCNCCNVHDVAAPSPP